MDFIIKKYLFAFAVILLCTASYHVSAQSEHHRIDSLKLEVLTSKNDSIKAHQLRTLSFAFRKINIDSSFFYINKSIDLAREIKQQRSIANALFDKGYLYYHTENYDQSLKFDLLALEIYIKEKDSLNISGIYTNMGIISDLNSDKQAAIDYYIKALEISSLINNSVGLANNSNNIGLIYRDLKNYDKAIEYLNRTLEIDLNSGIEMYIAQSYSNLARTYLPAKEFDKTYENLSEALKRMAFVEEADVKIEILSCAGEYYLELNKPDSAIKYISEALTVAETANRKRTLSYTYFLIGRYLMVKERFSIAITHINEAIKLSDSLNIKENVDEYYDYISQAYLKNKDFKNAHLNLKKSNEVKDAIHSEELTRSLGNFEKQSELFRIQTEFQVEQKLKQSELEKGEIRLKLVSLFSIIIIIFLVIIVIVVINNYRNKTSANKHLKEKSKIIEQQSEELRSTINNLEVNEEKLKNLNATKDKFFSIIAHDLKNPFNVLLGYSDLLVNEPSIKTDPKKLDKITKSILSTTEFSYELLENLLAWSRSQTEGLKVEPINFNLSELIGSQVEFFKNGAESKQIKLIFNVDKNLHVHADQNMILTTLRNLISNAIKFTKRGGSINITSKHEGDKIIFSVRDNGIGINSENQKKLFLLDSDFKINGTDNETGTGLGLILCKEFINKNGGEISVQSEEGKGSIFTFTLPIAKTDE